MNPSDLPTTDSLIEQAEKYLQQLQSKSGDPSQQGTGWELADACHRGMLDNEASNRLYAIKLAVSGASLIEALRKQGNELPDWLDITEEQLCRFGGVWIHEYLTESGTDTAELGRHGLDLLQRLNQIHAGKHPWIRHQISDLEKILKRSTSIPTTGIHYAIQDHGSGVNLPALVKLLEGPGVSIDISLDGTEEELQGLRRVLDIQGSALSLRRSPPVSWAGVGVYGETLAAMERALKLADWSYFINVSGSCLPLGSSAWIQQMLQDYISQGTLGFCDSVQLGEPLLWISSQNEPTPLGECHRLTAYDRVHWLMDPSLKGMMEEQRIDPARQIEMRVGLMYTEMEKNTYWVRPLRPDELRERASFLAEHPLRYGRNWVVLHRSIVEWLLGSAILQRVRSFLEGCFIGDEMIFAMTLFSQENPYQSAMLADNLRHWQGGPQRISLDEIPSLLGEGNRLMVRKIAQDDFTAAADLVRGFNRT